MIEIRSIQGYSYVLYIGTYRLQRLQNKESKACKTRIGNSKLGKVAEYPRQANSS